MSDAPRPPSGQDQMKSAFAPILVAIVIIVTAGFVAFLVMRNRSGTTRTDATMGPGTRNDTSQSLSNPDEYSFMTVPAFTLVDQDGRAVDNSILKGQYTVAEFMFSHCQLVCPIMKSNLMPAVEALRDTPVRFVSFSVDPVHDTPEHLTAYAAKLGIDTTRWSLLTGEPGAVRDICATMGFVPPEPDGKSANLIDLGGGETMENIIHPTRFIVFDPEGRVVGMYNGVQAADAQQMVRDLKRVAAP